MSYLVLAYKAWKVKGNVIMLDTNKKNLMHMHVLTVSKLFHLLPILLLIKIIIIINRAARHFQEHLERQQHNRH